MAEIQFIEDIKDTVTDFKKKVGNRNFYLICGGIGAVGIWLLLRKKEKYTGEYVNADEIVGYPTWSGYSEYGYESGSGGGGSDGSNDGGGSNGSDGSNGSSAGNGTGSWGGGSTSGSGSIVGGVVGDEILDYQDEEEKEIVDAWWSGTTSRDDYDTTSKNDAFWKYYDEVTGGGNYYTVKYDDGSKKTFYRPNKPQGVDSDGDGKISVSFDRDGNMISSEFTEGHTTVHRYGDEVTTTVHSSDRRASNSKTTKQDVTDLPTYTGSKKSSSSSSGGKSITVSRGSSSSSKNKDVASKISGGYTSSSSSLKTNKSTAKVSKPGKNAKKIG